MPRSSVHPASTRRKRVMRTALTESQLQAYFLARETLRRLRRLPTPGAIAEARHPDPRLR